MILAILAALLIPALTGYIDKAKEKQIIAETRQAVMAAQTIADEQYGDGTLSQTGNSFCESYSASIGTLAEVSGTNITKIAFSSGKISELVYSTGTKKCTYSKNGNAYTYKVE